MGAGQGHGPDEVGRYQGRENEPSAQPQATGDPGEQGPP